MIEQISKTCHRVHRTYCILTGEKTQPEWSKLTLEHKNVIATSVRKILSGELTTVKVAHEQFVKMKSEQGWKYGEAYSIENKINPRLCKFEDLRKEDKMKETLFFEIVISFI